MSFGYAVGDVIAVLGLFERIAVELRNYKNAPAHFQQLRIELDLVYTTLQHVLYLEPESEIERQTLDQVRAIAIHCSQPLQAMADKMRCKEGSLGHFRTTRSLSNISTRLHWSMIAQSDVDELRKIIMSEMVAINILLSVQQLSRIKGLALRDQRMGSGNHQSLVIERHTNAIVNHTSTILAIVSKAESAVAGLASNAAAQAKENAKQAQALNQNLTAVKQNLNALSRKTESNSAIFRRHAALITRHAQILFRLLQDLKELFALLATCSKEMLEAIGRSTRMLLDLSGQMKRIIRAVEAIPLHLNLGVVRLDDALGESWALPLQACRTWNSFCDILQLVVYANGRAGANLIARNQFAISLATTGKELNSKSWPEFVKSGLHLEQAMIISGANPYRKCSNPECEGSLKGSREKLGQCNACNGAPAEPKFPSLLSMHSPSSSTYLDLLPRFRNKVAMRLGPRLPLPRLPPLRFADEANDFCKIKAYEPAKPIENIEDACHRLEADPTNPDARTFIGLQLLRRGEELGDTDWLLEAKSHFEIAANSDKVVATSWYLLGRVNILLDDYQQAHNALQEAIYIGGLGYPCFWITAGTIFFHNKQWRDSLDAFATAIRLNYFLYEAWYNLGVLYDTVEQPQDAEDCFERCLKCNPALSDVQARLHEMQNHPHPLPDQDLEGQVPKNHFIYAMRDCDLQIRYEATAINEGADFHPNPIREATTSERDDYSGGEFETDTESSYSGEGTDEEE